MKQREGCRLLLVADRKELLSQIEGHVKDAGEKYIAYTATTEKQMIFLAEDKLPDIIFIDLDSKKTKIRKILQSLDDIKQLKDIPALFIAGDLSSWSHIKGFAGTRITDIIKKPVDRTELLLRLDNLLLLSNTNSELKLQKEKINKLTGKLKTAQTEFEKLTVVACKTENAVIIANNDAEIQWANDGFTKLFGYTIDEFKKLKGSSMIEASFNPNIEQVIKKCISQKRSISYTAPSKTKSGKDIWVQTILTPVIDNNENVRNLVAIDQDITSLKLAQEAVKQQKEEMTTQKEHIIRVNRELERLSFVARETRESTNRQLEWKNIQITDSINYAKRIQKAIFPSVELFKKYCPDSFILHRPKDIVSGDFYWYTKCMDDLYIAAVDCTGHGIPGAFMSLIGTTLLNEIVDEKNVLIPSDILEKLNLKVIDSLNKGENDEDVRYDGMDASLCRIDKEKGEVQIASANQYVFVFKNNKVISIEGDLYSIGGIFARKPDAGFVNHIIKIEKQTTIYLFSDGFQNQLGGEENKKFMITRFRELLVDIQAKSMREQYEILNTRFDSWKGERKQTDDVLVIGLRISI